MNKNQKAEMIAEIKDQLSKATAVYLVNYSGINVDEINGLRREFRKEGVRYKVYKNTLFKKALLDLDRYPEFQNTLEGMIGTAFAGENNFVAPAKIIKKFSDEKKKLSLAGCYIDSQFYAGDQLNTLASMPTKEEIMASIVGSINAPISGVVGAINAVMRDLVMLVDEISKKKAA